jgi:NADH dehydrogenase/NADH:ubiquinone oxidoreductase subunit G
MAEVALTIDGRELTLPADSTILEAARRADIAIPALCHDPRLEPFTSCWLCVVEVEGARGPMPACTAKVADGMVVRTRSEGVVQHRRQALELLLSAK